jgi:hypothetical protein
MTEQKKGAATLEQIAEWKSKYGKIFSYEVDDLVCYFKTVDRQTYAAAVAKVASGKIDKFNDTIIANIWLQGAEEIKTVDRYYFGLIDQIEELMNKAKGTLGEL